MDIEEMKVIREQKHYSYEKLSELSGVPLGTIRKIFGGSTKHPQRKTLEALERVLEPDWGRRMDDSHNYYEDRMVNEAVTYEGAVIQKVREEAFAYGKSTIKDYYALPAEKRVELIDGQFYNLAAPSTFHQIIVSEIFAEFRNYIKEKEGTCRAFVAPVDVQLDQDIYTMVQPDMMVVCDPKKVLEHVIFGAPDLVVEVLSKSTRKKDMTKKLQKYVYAGVKEYWIVDAEQQRVLVYDFASELYPAIYGFEDKIPVGIYEGDLKIDFSEIKKLI